jgi:hypothetical protein
MLVSPTVPKQGAVRRESLKASSVATASYNSPTDASTNSKPFPAGAATGSTSSDNVRPGAGIAPVGGTVNGSRTVDRLMAVKRTPPPASTSGNDEAEEGEESECDTPVEGELCNSPAMEESSTTGGGVVAKNENIHSSRPIAAARSGLADVGLNGPTGSANGKPGAPSSHSGDNSIRTMTTGNTATSQKEKSTTKKKKKEKKKIFNLSLCKYAVIEELANEFGFTIDQDEEVEQLNFDFLWSDTVLPLQKIVRLQGWQRVNHFPSMHLLCKKVHLGVTLGRMRKIFPGHYAFFPRTWSLRSERVQFQRHFQQTNSGKKKLSKIYIMKPNAGCQGKGIVITRDPLEAVAEPEAFVVQEYIMNPLLIEGKKFDLRVYILVTSVRHFSAFIFNDGLVRMCAEPYVKPNDENMANTCVHLTNYAVNKHSDQFVFNTDGERSDVGNKRDFRWFNEWLSSQGHDVAALWERIEYMTVKTLIAALAQMTHVYNSCFPHGNEGYTCFELLGLDVMIDENLKPWLLEVNHTPSFTCDTPLDKRIKSTLIREAWNIVGVKDIDRVKYQEKERQQILKRMLSTKTAANANAHQQTQAQQGSSSSSPASPSQPSASFPSAAEEDILKPVEQMVADNRKREDSQLQNFRRIYPSRDPNRQSTYDELFSAAKELTSVQSTASQDQRQQELKQERERREQDRVKNLPLARRQSDTSTATASSAAKTTASPSALVPSSSVETPIGSSTSLSTIAMQMEGASARSARERRSGRADRKEGSFSLSIELDGTPPESELGAGWKTDDEGCGGMGTGTMHSSLPSDAADGSGPSTNLLQPVGSSFRCGPTGSPLPQRPSHPSPKGLRPGRSSVDLGSPCESTPTSTTTTGVSSKTVPTEAGTGTGDEALEKEKEKRRRRQARLNAQIENHRRRMVLGPRLSVFQLRESQLETLHQEPQLIDQYLIGLNGGSIENGGPQQPTLPLPPAALLQTALQPIAPAAASSSSHGVVLDPQERSTVGSGGATRAQLALARDAQVLAEYYTNLAQSHLYNQVHYQHTYERAGNTQLAVGSSNASAAPRGSAAAGGAGSTTTGGAPVLSGIVPSYFQFLPTYGSDGITAGLAATASNGNAIRVTSANQRHVAGTRQSNQTGRFAVGARARLVPLTRHTQLHFEEDGDEEE